ncbi:MAG: hypothetical protein AAFU78_00010 [Cyanobacteria bacterium J06633_2]
MTLLDRIHAALITQTPRALTAKTALWWGLSISIPILFGVMALQDGFRAERIVQDDARQYLFWMQRFQQPELFSNDLIADYFQSVTPVGYTLLYRVGTWFGIAPFTFNKLLPLILGVVTTGYFFWVVMAMVPLPITACLASLLLNQTLWMKDDLVSATPRAFLYPFFTAFLYYWLQSEQETSGASPSIASKGGYLRGHRIQLKRSLILGLASIALLGLFYPQYVLVIGGIVLLSVMKLKPDHVTLECRSRAAWIRIGSSLIVVIAIVAFYALTASTYGPVVTLEQAKIMPEFWPGGRSFFFSENLWWFYAVGDRSGFLHVGLVRPATLALGLFLPMLLWRSPSHPVVQQCQPSLSVLLRLLLSASGLFVLAHLLLFQMHLPSRYTDHSLRIIMAIASAIIITTILEYLVRPRPQSRSNGRRLINIGIAILFSTAILAYPVVVDGFPLTKYKQGRNPKLYEFLKTQPADTLVASVAEDVNNIPVFAQRPILVGREYAIPYHLGFYSVFHDRAVDLLRAQYSPDPEVAIAVIQAYGIDYWLLDQKAYDSDYLEDNWTRQYISDLEAAMDDGPNNTPPALAESISPCLVMQQNPLLLLDAHCISEQLTEKQP